MKLARWTTGLLSICSLLGSNLLLSPVTAQCIQADISVQYNISGSQEPTERTNDVDFYSDAACQGNVSVTTGVQGNVGGNRRVQQRRTVRHRFNNNPGATNQVHNTIQIQSNPAIDVYNAADNLDY